MTPVTVIVSERLPSWWHWPLSSLSECYCKPATPTIMSRSGSCHTAISTYFWYAHTGGNSNTMG